MAYPSADTFSSLIDEVITSLQGYGTDNDAVATLINDCSATTEVLSVDDTDDISRGLIEIDEEIMYVTSADQGQVFLQQWGRGYKGTVGAGHTAGSQVSIAPTWPRAVVAREVNNTIRAVYPNLFAVGSYDTTASPVSWQYTLPVNVDRILAVDWRWGDVNDLDGWMPIRSWEMLNAASTTDFSTGKALVIGEPMVSGAKLHVTYAMAPTLLVNPTDAFTLSGLPASSRDVIVYGTAARLLPWQDTARIPVETVSSDAQDTTKPVGNAVGIAREIRTLYTARLADEVRSQMNRYPARQHKVR